MVAVNRGEELLQRQFEVGPLSPEEDQELQTLLDSSEALRRSYARWVELERGLEGRDVPQAQIDRLLARGTPAPASVGLEEALLTESGGGADAKILPIRRRSGWWLAGSFGALTAAAVALMVVRTPKTDFRARSGSAEGRQAWISIFQASGPEAQLSQVKATARSDRAFAFAFTTLAQAPGFLAIVGRDAEGRIHWFHPAYTDLDDRPQSLPVEAGRADVELGELVKVDPAPGMMAICGLFTDGALDIQTVDVSLEAGADWPPAAVKDCHTVDIQDP